MVRLLFATIGTFLFATTAIQPALANKNVVASKVGQNQVVKNITPFNLVVLAYRGQIQGISGYHSLLNSIAFKEVTGKDLVQYGIDNGRLSPETIDNSDYIRTVEYKVTRFVEEKLILLLIPVLNSSFTSIIVNLTTPSFCSCLISTLPTATLLLECSGEL